AVESACDGPLENDPLCHAPAQRATRVLRRAGVRRGGRPGTGGEGGGVGGLPEHGPHRTTKSLQTVQRRAARVPRADGGGPVRRGAGRRRGTANRARGGGSRFGREPQDVLHAVAAGRPAEDPPGGAQRSLGEGRARGGEVCEEYPFSRAGEVDLVLTGD